MPSSGGCFFAGSVAAGTGGLLLLYACSTALCSCVTAGCVAASAGWPLCFLSSLNAWIEYECSTKTHPDKGLLVSKPVLSFGSLKAEVLGAQNTSKTQGSDTAAARQWDHAGTRHSFDAGTWCPKALSHHCCSVLAPCHGNAARLIHEKLACICCKALLGVA
eukprot:1142638-Pelagomonas_calceolata.AAC.6